MVINDFLYGDANGNDLSTSLEDQYDKLTSWTSKQWSDLLTKYYITPANIVIRGKPSAALQNKLETDEKARLADQVKKLGPEGLAELEKKLTAAKAEHEQPIPEEMLTSFPVPDAKRISWISVQSAKNAPSPSSASKGQHPIGSSELEKHLAQDATPLPLTVQFDHVNVSQIVHILLHMLIYLQSEFTTIHTLMSLAKLPENLRPYVKSAFALVECSFFVSVMRCFIKCCCSICR